MNDSANNSTNNLIRQKRSISTKHWWQKRAFTIGTALFGLILVLVVISLNVVKYETHLTTGNIVLLELAPVDPRGFMQGDYMTLNYALEREVLDILYERNADGDFDLDTTQGYIVVTVDDNHVGQFLRLTDGADTASLANNEMAIHYRVRNNQVKLATNAFFFQEGQAEAFEAAEYGMFRVNEKGEPLLTAMVDDNFKIISGINNDTIENSKNAKGLENMGRQGSGM